MNEKLWDADRVVAPCTWCGEAHENPITLDPLALGGLARRMGTEAFRADCATVLQWILR